MQQPPLRQYTCKITLWLGSPCHKLSRPSAYTTIHSMCTWAVICGVRCSPLSLLRDMKGPHQISDLAHRAVQLVLCSSSSVSSSGSRAAFQSCHPPYEHVERFAAPRLLAFVPRQISRANSQHIDQYASFVVVVPVHSITPPNQVKENCQTSDTALANPANTPWMHCTTPLCPDSGVPVPVPAHLHWHGSAVLGSERARSPSPGLVNGVPCQLSVPGGA